MYLVTVLSFRWHSFESCAAICFDKRKLRVSIPTT